jgi:hypothetical protein
VRNRVLVIISALFSGIVVWYFGLGVLPAIVVALVIGAMGVMLRVFTDALPDRSWPPPPPPKIDGARREASELSWSLESHDGLVDERIVVRVRTIAENRLSARRLDLSSRADRPTIERLIGSPAVEVLTAAGSRRVHVSALLATLDRLDSLGTGTPTTQPPNSEKQARK